jgi:hypothetical protein
MATYNFTTKTNSATVRIDGGDEMPINGLYAPTILPGDKTLRGKRKYESVREFNINVDDDTINIDMTPFAGSTATELYDALEGLFFLADGSGGGGLTSETIQFSWDDIAEGAGVVFNSIVSVDGFTSANAAGKQVPPTATIKEIRLILSGSSSSAAAGDVTVQVQRREAGDGFAYTAGAGTSVEVGTYTIGGALGPLFDRAQRTTGLSTAIGGTNPVLYAYVSSAGFATLTSLIMDVTYEY